MKIRGVWIALLVTTLAVLGGAMTLSHRQTAAENRSSLKPSPTTASQVKRTVRGAQFQGEILAFERKRVKREPLSATLLIEETPEGSSETRTTTSLIYRDAEGRTRRDQMRANSANTVETTTITDPVAGFAYELKHSDSTARRMRLSPQTDEKTRDAMAAMRNSIAAKERAGSYQILPVPADGSPKELRPKGVSIVSGGSKSEALGEKDIEGVATEGTRTIVTIPARTMGNERAMDIVTERWYSSNLNTVVLMERLDPRFGRSVLRLTGLLRTEPAVSLFSVPGKYKILIE